jgi:hypothetical protein
MSWTGEETQWNSNDLSVARILQGTPRFYLLLLLLLLPPPPPPKKRTSKFAQQTHLGFEALAKNKFTEFCSG